MTFIMSILSWLASGPLDRIFKTIDNSVDNQTTREQIKADLAKSYLSSQVAILTGRGWWFPLLFMVPAGLWFAAVCVYSVLWCKGCAYPQTWTIAALPPPLDQWMGAIIGSLFIGKAGGEIISQLKR
ncbi:hypothetical protein ABIF38_005279 [Bradyrhizobium japonicum]|uniref:hypothetical protein n=1 Tax=Bradyrhizobium elkanii TaxID=29448 RepID=UPI00036B0EC1|nr:hypothetical protein [Bradyrhizobium elkanii]MCP1732409.1 hypothetical protein [Bradyrhizobium elkanii]MCS3567747.1 hypothetical protein [Bradyrhizobium elkanii]MCS3590770.1 hypothetical protein [Bradyrhizobium elkanii]MCS3620213.1 hypothetical protein [Bradyrhizobium elkanii]GEC56767.1 hypothetical protein BEL01nite_58100 [Bradyrhizobium elkanii]